MEEYKYKNELFDIQNNKIEEKKIIIIKSIILLILIIILYFSFKSYSINKTKDYLDEDYNNLDIINEELRKARNCFKQDIYIDSINSAKSLYYNIFIPQKYSNIQKYPLLVYIGDERMMGKEIKSPIIQSIGGIIWATEAFQKRHKCFILVPFYNEIIIDDRNGYFKNEYINVTIRLISLIKSKYPIDSERIYGTGQSMGAMILLYLLANYQNLFSAGLIVDGQWKIDELNGLINSTFTYIVSEGDENAFKGQNEVKQFFDYQNIKYGSINNINAQENVKILDIYAKNMYTLGYRHNFITYAKGTVLSSKNKIKNEHLASFKYGYRIEAVKEWLFSQIMKNYEDFYNSKDGRLINTNFCEKANENNICIKCLDGYYLSLDQLSCTKEINCESGDSKRGLCNSCKKNYYLDMVDRKCKSYIENEEYKFCKIIIRGVCTLCENYYFLDKENKCSISDNCSKSKNNLCIICLDGFFLGLDNKCTNIEKCIYSNHNECIECENGYFYDRVDKTCNYSIGNFANCKANNIHNKKRCSVCKENYYLSQSDYLCYDNTKKGPFYKCQISNFKGNLCQFCIKDYILGKLDFKCTKIEGCIRSENENKCLECDEGYCLDKDGKCVNNYYINENDNKYYYKCKFLNEIGNKCKICENDLIPNKEGICYDDIHCKEKDKNGICQKCQKENSFGYYSYCLNKYFGCIDSFLNNCIKCDDIFNFDICTKCDEGYEINKEGKCIISKK